MDKKVGESNRYKHYKGEIYEIEKYGILTEGDGELAVIYHNINKPDETYIRPYTMFFGTVKIDGKDVLRFEPIDGGVLH